MAITRAGVLGRPLISIAVLLLVGDSGSARAFDFVGPNKCTGCHDHEIQKEWAEKKEGPKGHLNALAQLEEKKSAGYARAIGLADVYDLKGSCVKCHATVFKGDASFGVSCESCHGAGSAFLEPHQKKGSYRTAVGLGMFDTRVGDGGSYKILAEMCIACHYMKDKKLVAAGHSSGVGWDLREKTFGQIVHWKEAVDKDKVGAAGRVAYARASGGAAPAEPKVAAPSAPTDKKAAPKAEPAKPVKPESKPAPRVETPVTSAPPAAPRTEKKPEPRATSAPSARPAARPPVPAPAAPAEPTAPAPEPAPVATPPPAPPLASPAPNGPVSEAAYARGQVLAALERALRAGKTLEVRPAPPAAGTAEYQGPDAELLRLQEEVLVLELEALSPRPAPSPTPLPKERKP